MIQAAWMNRAAVFIALVIVTPFLTAASCHQLPPEPPFVFYRDGGAPPDDAAVDPPDCVAACANMKRLGCPEAEPAGRTCGGVCAAALKTKRIDLHLFCVANAQTIEDVRECRTVRCLQDGGR